MVSPVLVVAVTIMFEVIQMMAPNPSSTKFREPSDATAVKEGRANGTTTPLLDVRS
jgi:hypothetical protein